MAFRLSEAQTKQQREEKRRRDAALAAGAGVAVVAGAPKPSPDVPSPAARAAAAKRLIEALVAFFAQQRERVRVWLRGQLAAAAPGVSADVIEQVLAEEDQRQLAFDRKAQERVARAVTVALAIPDARLREEAMRGIAAREQRFAQQRAEAMLARSSAAVERIAVKQVSPTGAFWKLDPNVREHTAGCLILGEKFWPWEVLDRVHPPRHAGCPCRLIGYAAAVADGLLIPSQIMDVGRAVQLAAGVVMEGIVELDVDAALALVEDGERYARAELREAVARHGDVVRFDELIEAFDRNQARYPKGHPRAGQWRPKIAVVGSAQQRGAFTKSMSALRKSAERPSLGTASAGGGPAVPVTVPHSTEELQAIGKRIGELADAHGTHHAYRERIRQLNDEQTAIEDEKWKAIEAKHGSADAAYDWAGAEAEKAEAEGREWDVYAWEDAFYTDAQRARLAVLKQEVHRNIDEMDRARRDALLGVLQQMRPMGGRVKVRGVGRMEHTEKHDYRHEATKDERAAVEASLRQVEKFLPADWIESGNAGDGVQFDISDRRAYHRLEDAPGRMKQEDRIDRFIESGAAEFAGYQGPFPVLRSLQEHDRGRLVWLNWVGEGRVLEGEAEARFKPGPRVRWRPPSTIRVKANDPSTLLHEMGHRVEAVHGRPGVDGNRPIEQAMQKFLRERAGGSQTEKLADIYPNSAYEEHETAWRDKFIDAYIGRDYSGRASEVLTMGLQFLWFPERGRRFDSFDKPDEPMRDFVLGALASL